MRTPPRRSIAQVLKIAALVADHYDSASGLTLTASRADLLKTLAQSRPRSYGAGDTFLTVPYRPILPRLDCHAWLSVRRPERRVGARLSRAPDVAGCVAIPSYSPADSESAGFLCIAAYIENSLFCRIQRVPGRAGSGV